MLSYEQIGKMALEILSGSFIVSKWKAVSTYYYISCVAPSIPSRESFF